MVTFESITSTYSSIREYINKTPVMTSSTLNRIHNAEFYIKCENFQKVGAFKYRGAYNAIRLLSDVEKRRGVIAHSSGNHAQALALAAKNLGIKAVIVMPDISPQVKVNATRDTYKAEVVFCENTVQSRHSTTEALIEKHGYTLVHPYDNDNVINGAGTAAYELLNEVKDLDKIFCPVGGGGLLSGTAISSKGFNSLIKVYGAEPEKADDASRSFVTGNIETNQTADTIADGLRTNLCERTLSYITQNVDNIITVNEEEILAAMKFYWERMKIIVEPSGVVSLASAIKSSNVIKGKKVGIIISGGNVDIKPFFDYISK